MRAVQLARVMRRWAELAPVTPEVSWAPVARLIEAAEQLGKALEGWVRDLSERYGAQLGGLGDPLSVSMTWLERSYELAYSRWLAWALEQMGSAHPVWRVLGLPDPPSEASRLTTQTEVQISPEGRLDIVVYCGETPHVVVEVKLCGAEYEEKSQLRRYRKWLERKGAKGVLLVVDAERKEYSGFAPRRWLDVCIELRRAARGIAGTKPLVVAMILAFVGAVEQNLLGFPSLGSKIPPLAYHRLARHLDASLEGGH